MTLLVLSLAAHPWLLLVVWGLVTGGAVGLGEWAHGEDPDASVSGPGATT